MKVVITDLSKDLSCDNQTVIRWNGYSDKKLEISIPNYVDKNGQSLKKKYINWNLFWFQNSMQNKFFNKHCRIGEDFEYLKASRIYEKSIWKSPIFDAVKLIALEEILLGIAPIKVDYIGNSAELHQSYKILCNNLSIAYESNITKPFRRLAPYNKRNKWVPESIKAMVHFISRLKSLHRYKNRTHVKQFNRQNSILLCMPFFNFNCHTLKENEYRSEFLKELPKLIKNNDLNINWLHYFVKSKKFPNDNVAINCLDLVEKSKENDVHRLIGEYANLSILVRVFTNWLKISTLSFVIRTPIESFQPIGSKVSLWPILKNDWYRSLRGPDLIDNLLFYELFNNALKHIKPQKYGFILYENQGLERIFSYLWHKYNHGKLVGIVHSTVRFWDLRYAGKFSKDCPTEPDLVAVNGNGAWNELKASGHPIKKLVKVEALRYGYLTNRRNVKRHNEKDTRFYNRILVLGDYNDFDTNELMSLISSAISHIDRDIYIHFKPHPNYSIKDTDYPNLKIVFEAEQLEDILSKFHIAIATNKTTASVEAYIAGLKTIVMLDKNDLNFSPLRGLSGVSFVSSQDDLVKVLCDKEYLVNNNNNLDYFYLDPNFKLWKKMLQGL
jgi:surface carbohydrate biosynthesis protein (TIGR04326 family)